MNVNNHFVGNIFQIIDQLIQFVYVDLFWEKIHIQLENIIFILNPNFFLRGNNY
jgi:hypothetical protein